jgi:hypothetical protein
MPPLNKSIVNRRGAGRPRAWVLDTPIYARTNNIGLEIAELPKALELPDGGRLVLHVSNVL